VASSTCSVPTPWSAALTFVLICLLLGSTFMALKTAGDFHRRALRPGPVDRPGHRGGGHRLHHLDPRTRQ